MSDAIRGHNATNKLLLIKMIGENRLQKETYEKLFPSPSQFFDQLCLFSILPPPLKRNLSKPAG